MLLHQSWQCYLVFPSEIATISLPKIDYRSTDASQVVTSYTRQTFRLWTFWFHSSGQLQKVKSGLVGCYLQWISVTVFTIWETSVLQQLPAMRLSPAPVFFKAFAVSCFSRQLQSFPPTNGAGKGPATSQHDRGLLALINPLLHIYVHPLSSSLGENTSLTSQLGRKSYLSCGRQCRYSLILDGYFQVIHNVSSIIQKEHKRLETTSTKKCFSPGELALIFLMCLLRP